MASIRIRFSDGVFVPEGEVDLPEGSVWELDPEAHRREPFKLSDLARTMPDNPDTPDDLAANLDHYLHGRTRQG